MRITFLNLDDSKQFRAEQIFHNYSLEQESAKHQAEIKSYIQRSMKEQLVHHLLVHHFVDHVDGDKEYLINFKWDAREEDSEGRPWFSSPYDKYTRYTLTVTYSEVIDRL